MAKLTPEPRSRSFLPTKSTAALLAAFVTLGAIALLSYRSLVQRSVAAEAVQRADRVREQLFATLNAVEDAETAYRGYLLSNDERFLDPYTHALITAPAALRDLRASIAGDPSETAKLETLDTAIQAKLAFAKQAIDAQRAGNTAHALELVNSDHGRQLMEQIRDITKDMLVVETRLRDLHTAAWEGTLRWSTYVALGGSGVLAFVLMLLGFFASRDFRAVEADGWIRRILLSLGKQIQGDQQLTSLGDKVLGTLAANLDVRVGSVYVTEAEGLRRIASFAVEAGEPGDHIKRGEGLVGQVAKDQRLLEVHGVPKGYMRVTSSTGAAEPRELVLLPTSVDDALHGVIELGLFEPLDAVERSALERAAETIAIAIRSARDRSRLEELLHETQAQAEELQAQQEQLRVTNEELEQQSRSLQLSQTQLENQQAELEQINAQLEEQTVSLERQRDELARAGAELRRANEYKSQFLANMSHELRTPLNSTLILAKLLADNRENNLNEEQVKFANTIYSAGNDLLTLINDILDLSKIEAGMIDVRGDTVVLSRLADDLRATFKPVANEKQLDFSVVLAPQLPATIETDATRLQQILKNLLSNALKFTDQGAVTMTVTAAGGRLQFAVKDSGIGVAHDQQELIFEAFRQADGASTRKHGGTGLGLSISRDLARLLGGELSVESAPGLGSTFTLVLPAKLPARTAAPLPARSAAPVAPAAKPAQVPAAPRQQPREAPIPDDRSLTGDGAKSLMIVEDDLAFARVLADLARELGYLVVAADTGDDAIALARLHQPSAIVLDVGLPDRSGLSVLDALKRDPRTRHIPVHVVSVSDYTRTALEMGAVGYAIKPVERERLIEAIHHLEAKFTNRVRRVLIVEDDPLLRESTARLLASDNVKTIVAGTTAEALRQLEETTFDCMVLDLSLPDRSGIELLQEMSQNDHRAFPPVIVYTGRKLTTEQVHQLEKFSRSIIIKGARSPERLLDEVTLFLHQVESEMPPERQSMLRDVRDREAVFEGRRVLVVEDDVRNIFALSSVLQPKGALVEVARNGREAVEMLERNPEFDLVLMDIMMPEMDGLEAMRRLRAQPRFAKLPIIALTAKAMIDDREKCLEAGANDYIAKPLDVDKLLSLARVWVRR